MKEKKRLSVQLIAIKSVFLTFFCLIGLGAQAQGWLSEEMISDKYVQAATKEACGKIKPADLYGGLAFDALYAGKFPSEKFNNLVAAIFREEFAKNTVYLLSEDQYNQNELWLLHSPGFLRAVNACFNENKDRERFKKLVSNRKRAGMAAGVVASVAALSGVSSALQKVSAGLYRLWIAAGVGVVGYQAYDQTVELLKDLKTHREINATCGETPKVECVMEVLAKISARSPDESR